MGKTVTEDKSVQLAAELGLDALPATKIEDTTVEVQEVVTETVATPAVKPEDVPDVNFRRMKPTTVERTVTNKRPVAKTKPVTKQEQYDITCNASLITYPVDRYGVTREMKKVLTRTASRVAGDKKKYDLVIETLEILSKHIKLKFEADVRYRKILSERSVSKAKEQAK